MSYLTFPLLFPMDAWLTWFLRRMWWASDYVSYLSCSNICNWGAPLGYKSLTDKSVIYCFHCHYCWHNRSFLLWYFCKSSIGVANDDLRIAYIAWCLCNDWCWILLRPIGRHWWIEHISLLDQWLASMPGNCLLEFFFMAKSSVLEAMKNMPTSSDFSSMTEICSYWCLLGWLSFAFENEYLFVFWTQKWILLGKENSSIFKMFSPPAGFHWVAYDVKVAYIVRLFYLWLRNYLSEAFVLLFLFLFDCIFRKMVYIPMIWIKSCLLMFL